MIVNLKNPTDLSGLYFVYYGSTSLERDGWRGISHMGEHLFCKNFDDLQDELQENGISWNAYTSDNEIVFHFTGLEEYLAPYRDILVDRLSKIKLTPEEVAKEKNIVLQEYLDCFTDQSEAFRLNFMRRKHGSYEAIGLREDIENFTYEDFVEFFNLQYKHPDMLISVSKDTEYQNDALVFADRKALIRSEWNPEPNAILEPVPESEVDKTCVMMEQVVAKDDIAVIAIINNMLSNGLNSPLYQEIREKKGLVYFLYCYQYALGNKCVQRIYTMTSSENVDKFHETLADVFAKKEEHLTQKRLDMIRKSGAISRKKALINRHANVDDIINPEKALMHTLLETITLDEIYAVYDKYFSFDKFECYTDKDFVAQLA